MGYKPSFSILDAQDSTAILRDLGHKEEIEDTDNSRWIISRWKNDFISVEQAAQMAKPTAEENLPRVCMNNTNARSKPITRWILMT